MLSVKTDVAKGINTYGFYLNRIKYMCSKTKKASMYRIHTFEEDSNGDDTDTMYVHEQK